MRRFVAVGLVLAVLTAASGCARPEPRSGVVVPTAARSGTDQGGAGSGTQGADQGSAGAGTQGTGQGVAGAGAGSAAPTPPEKAKPLGLATITGTPVDWVESFPRKEPRNLVQLTDNACATDGAGLTVDLRAAEWAPHPLAHEPFWGPSVVVVACNATGSPMKAPRLRLDFDHGDGREGYDRAELPDLAPGQAVGPVRLFGARGVPAAVGATWQEHGDRWPSVTVALMEGERVIQQASVRRALAGAAAEAPGGGAPFPSTPTLDDLRKLSWSQADLGEKGQFFLYAPDISRTVQTDDFCGAVTGQFNASAKQWAVYRSVGGGAPEKVLELGPRGFAGNRGMRAEAPELLSTTFLFFGEYGTCANPTLYDVYAYDHATGTGYPVQMKWEDGQVVGARAGNYKLEPDGTLTTKGYNNAEGVWHIYTYKWDGAARTWIFASHVTE